MEKASHGESVHRRKRPTMEKVSHHGESVPDAFSMFELIISSPRNKGDAPGVAFCDS